MKEEKCIFCNYGLIKNDILSQSPNFFVKVGIGIFAPGHIMIMPRKHIACFAELPEQLTKEFLSLKETVFNAVKSKFSEPIIYEHGIYSQSINHAHIHFVPSKNSLYNLENIREKIFSDLKSTMINDIFEIRGIFQEEGSYCYLEENNQKLVFHTKGLPERKYTFRKEFARLTGLYGLVEWQNMAKEEKQRNECWVRETRDALSSFES